MGGFAEEQENPGLKTIIEDSKLGVSDMSINVNVDPLQKTPTDMYDIRAQYNSGKKERKKRSERIGG